MSEEERAAKYADLFEGAHDTLLWHTGRCLSYGEGAAY